METVYIDAVLDRKLADILEIKFSTSTYESPPPDPVMGVCARVATCLNVTDCTGYADAMVKRLLRIGD